MKPWNRQSTLSVLDVHTTKQELKTYFKTNDVN